jgi:hypothetical protein
MPTLSEVTAMWREDVQRLCAERDALLTTPSIRAGEEIWIMSVEPLGSIQVGEVNRVQVREIHTMDDGTKVLVIETI